MRKLTQEEFIRRCKETHSVEYDYSKVNYINAQTKVCIICHEIDEDGEEHGEFWVKPYNFLGGSICPKCNHHQWTTEKLIKAFKRVHGDKYDYSKVEYRSVREKVCIICNDLDRKGEVIGEFWQLPLEHLNGNGCERERRGIKEECWEKRICPICGKEFKVRKKYDKITCSEECRRKYIEIHKDEINKKKYESLKKTLENKTEEDKRIIIEKVKKTCLEIYGKENFSQTEEGRKISSENMKKNKHIWDEKYKKDVLIPKYREICEKDNLELLEFRNRFDCLVKCKQCGNIFITKTLGYLTDITTTNRCRICHPYEELLGPTNFENEFENFLKENDIKYYKNYREIIYPLEIDFYLPDYKIGIELDGLYWHSEIRKPDKNYHLNKTEKCLECDVRLIHIFEDEWLYKRDICKSILCNLLGKNMEVIGARKCVVKELQKEDCKDFININHIQGFIGFKYGCGLYYENELISVMTFGGLRKNLGNTPKENEYELLRYCTKSGVRINGGASKLLEYFIKNNHPLRIITYADRRWSNGNVYEKIGFKFLHNTQPNYSYVIGDKRKNRFGFRKDILVKKYCCPKDMTEKDFCLSQRWYRIYDCGSKYYEMVF